MQREIQNPTEIHLPHFSASYSAPKRSHCCHLAHPRPLPSPIQNRSTSCFVRSCIPRETIPHTSTSPHQGILTGSQLSFSLLPPITSLQQCPKIPLCNCLQMPADISVMCQHLSANLCICNALISPDQAISLQQILCKPGRQCSGLHFSEESKAGILLQRSTNPVNGALVSGSLLPVPSDSSFLSAHNRTHKPVPIPA